MNELHSTSEPFISINYVEKAYCLAPSPNRHVMSQIIGHAVRVMTSVISDIKKGCICPMLIKYLQLNAG